MTKDFFWMEAFQKNDQMFVRYYGKDDVWVEHAPIKPYCYVYGSGVKGGKKGDIRCAQTGYALTKHEVKFPEQMTDVRDARETWEADLSFERRIMMDKDMQISDGVRCYLDIETDDQDGPSDPEMHRIISIAMLFDDERGEVFLSNMPEKEMIERFLFEMYNVSMIITWNGGEDIWETRSFDMPYLSKRYGNQFEFDQRLRHVAFIDLYRMYKHEKTIQGKGISGGYGLENVSQYELGKGKVKHDGRKISELSDEELRIYNMTDVILVKELDDKLKLTQLKMAIARVCRLRLVDWRNNKKRSELTPIKQLDSLFLMECHKNRLVWPTLGWVGEHDKIPGATVLEPKVGLHSNVQNMDVQSMYPSIIINESISPDKDKSIMPSLLGGLLKTRREHKAKYKETGESAYDIAQYAYKVIANTVYGAMCNPGFRGYDRNLAAAVTSKGRALIEVMKKGAEALGYEVVYGDTDSVFVSIDKEKAPILLEILNNKISPYNLELGDFYERILFIGDVSGAKKKRYAGLKEGGELSIRGLESVKSDYCVLARETQIVVLKKLLGGESISQCKQYLRELRNRINSGALDASLMLTKGVKKLEDYVTIDKRGRAITKMLPHVRALEKAYDRGARNLYEVSYYFVGKDDVEPLVGENGKDRIPEGIAYERYWESQFMATIKPLFESIMIQDGSLKSRIPKSKMKVAMQSGDLFDYK